MAGTDFLLGLARALREVLRPLEVALENPEAFRILLLEHGWAIEDPDTDQRAVVADRLGFAATLETLSGELDRALRTDLSIDDAIALLELSVQSIRALRDLATGEPVAAGPIPFDRAEFWQQFPPDLVASLFAEFLEYRRPGLFATLLLVGVVDRRRVETDGTPGRVAFTRTEFRWNRLSRMFADPADLAREVYGWTGPLDHEALTDRLQRAAYAQGIPASRRLAHHELLESYYAPDNPVLTRLREVRAPLYRRRDLDGSHIELGLALLPIPPENSPQGAPTGLLVGLYSEGDVAAALPVGGLFELRLTGGFTADTTTGVEVRPGSVTARLAGQPEAVDAAVTLIGLPTTWWWSAVRTPAGSLCTTSRSASSCTVPRPTPSCACGQGRARSTSSSTWLRATASSARFSAATSTPSRWAGPWSGRRRRA